MTGLDHSAKSILALRRRTIAVIASARAQRFTSSVSVAASISSSRLRTMMLTRIAGDVKTNPKAMDRQSPFRILQRFWGNQEQPSDRAG
jgi:hypothetical protein